jgi:hypothetical protein
VKVSARDSFAFLDLLYRVAIYLRAHSTGPRRLPDSQLHDLMDAIHNVPLYLNGSDAYFTAEKLRELYLASYDKKWVKDGPGLVTMLDDAYDQFDAGGPG